MTEPADLDKDGDVDDSDIATALSNYTGPVGAAGGKTAADGDIDGDGDVDDSDLGGIFAAYTGPLSSAEIIDVRDVNSELASHDRVSLPGGSIVRGGTVIMPREVNLLVCTSGKRPVIEADRGLKGEMLNEADNQGRPYHAITNGTDHIERHHVSGIAVQSNRRDTAVGFRFRLNGSDGRFCKSLEILDCKANGYDVNYEVVDDWARKFGERVPGRIRALLAMNISSESHGSDNHSIGMYLEGLAEGGIVTRNAFDKSGWLVEADRNKMSHSIYAQRYGARLHECSDNVFSRAAANSCQLRAGCDMLARNIATQCGLGPFIMGKGGTIEDNLVIDEQDIKDIDGLDDFDRGHGYILSASDLVVRNNLAIRRKGSLQRIPAFKGLYGPKEFENNLAVDWAVDHLNFEVNGHKLENYGTNRTIRVDPGVPAFAKIEQYINRERGQAFEPTLVFINACREALSQ